MRQLAKLCDVRDFEDADILRMAREILPERDALAHVERKVWECAMLALFLEDVGRLNEGTSVLAIGAGQERMAFWLANRVGRVVATDIYGEGTFASREATGTMLTHPSAYAPFPYREDRLEVEYADARALPFPDASFDVAFSLSAIEHFGGRRDVARSAREMARVLRPGGHAFVVTEYFVRQPLRAAAADGVVRAASLGRKRLLEGFSRRQLETWVVRASGLALLQPLDLALSPESWENVTTVRRDGRLEPATGEFYPHVLLRSGRRSGPSVYTSVCLPLRKAPAAA